MHRRQGRRPVQRSGARSDTAPSGVSLERMIADLNPLLRGWAGYFGFSQWHELGIAGRLDTATLALRRLGPVEDARQALSGTPSPQGLREGGQCGHLQPQGTVAAELRRSALHRAFTNSTLHVWDCSPWRRWWALNPPNRRGTDPYARWCGRGGVARCPPIPIDASAAVDHPNNYSLSGYSGATTEATQYLVSDWCEVITERQSIDTIMHLIGHF